MPTALERVKIWTPFDNAKLTLATFDERGKCVEKVEGHNYTTDVLVGQMKWWTRQYITRRCGITSPTNDGGNNGTNIEWMLPNGNIPSYAAGASPTLDFYPSAGGQVSPAYPPVGVVLTSATHAEDPTNDRYIRGGLTAWSYVEGYAGGGSDTRRGGLNGVECVVSPTKAVFVFDWATNTGNGTMQSVYWTYTAFSGTTLNSWPDMYLQNASGTGYSTASVGSWLGSQATGFSNYSNGKDVGLYLDPDGVSYWTLQPNSATADCYMVKRTLGTGALVSTVRLNGSAPTTFSFTNDGSGSLGNWWTYDQVGNLKKWPAAGGTATSTTTFTTLGIPAPQNSGNFTVSTMFFQGGYIWLQSTPAAGPYRMYQILASGPTLAASITIPGTNAGQSVGPSATYSGLYYPDATNGDELWLTQGGAFVNRFDLSGNFRGTFTPGGVTNTMSGMSLYPGGGVIYSNSVYSTGPVQTCFITNNTRQFHARALLPSPVTKANTQTMKLTYEFDYV